MGAGANSGKSGDCGDLQNRSKSCADKEKGERRDSNPPPQNGNDGEDKNLRDAVGEGAAESGAAESTADPPDGVTCFMRAIRQLPPGQQQHMMRLLARWADEDPERLAAILALLGK